MISATARRIDASTRAADFVAGDAIDAVTSRPEPNLPIHVRSGTRDGHDAPLTSPSQAAGRFHAVLANEVGPDPLTVWSSDDGTNWRPDDDQPSLPVAGTLHDVSVVPFGGRLLIVAGMNTEDGTGVSVALLGPVLP